MADESTEPKGTLTVQITVRMPNPADTSYRWMHHPLPSQDVQAFDCNCTQGEARGLVEKIRAANPGLSVKAHWHGGQTL